MPLTIVGQRLGLGASRQSTYSILSGCRQSDPRMETSLHIFFPCECRRWIGGGFSAILTVPVAGLSKCYDACRDAATRDLVAAETIVKRNSTGFVSVVQGIRLSL